MIPALFETPVPGTYVAPGFVEPDVVEMPLEEWQRERAATAAGFDEPRVGYIVAHGRRVLALLLTHPERVATWDELKVARYRTLPPGRFFALVFPPPELYVNDPQMLARLEALSGNGRRPRHNLVLTEVAAPGAGPPSAWVLEDRPADLPIEPVWRCPECLHWLAGSRCPDTAALPRTGSTRLRVHESPRDP